MDRAWFWKIRVEFVPKMQSFLINANLYFSLSSYQFGFANAVTICAKSDRFVLVGV